MAPFLPSDLSDAMAQLRGQSNESLADYARKHLDQRMREIAEEPTWEAQRARVTRAILIEGTSENLYDVVIEAKHHEAWVDQVADHPIYKDRPAEQQVALLAQRKAVAFFARLSLLGLGGAVSWVSDRKANELEVYKELDKQTKA